MPLTLNQFRKDYPEYDNIPDAKLADGLHKKYYSDMDFETFAGKIDYQFKFEAAETETFTGTPQPPPVTPDESPTQTTIPGAIVPGSIKLDDITMEDLKGPEVSDVPLPDQSTRTYQALQISRLNQPTQPEELPKTSGLIKDIIKSGIRKGFVDSKIEEAKEAAEERKKEGKKEKKKVVEIKRDPSVLDIPTPTIGVQGPEDQQPLPDKAVSTTEKILAYAPYSITRAMRGLLDPFLPALKALGMDTGKALDTAVEYWSEKAGDIGLPDVGIGRSPEGDLEIQKREASLKEIIGQTAELSGFVAGPVKVASKLAGAVVSKIAQSARPFFKSVLKGMITGGLLGEGEKEQTLQYMALFGVFEGAGYGIGKASDIVKQIKQTRAWVKSGSKERGLMLQSLEDTLSKNPGMSEGEILKRWNNPQWKAEALAKRVKEPERPLTEDVKVEKPIVKEPVAKAVEPKPAHAVDDPGKLTSLQVQAEIKRMSVEQAKRQRLLSSETELNEFAKDKGLSSAAMRDLLESNYQVNEPRLKAFEDYAATSEFKTKKDQSELAAKKIPFKDLSEKPVVEKPKVPETIVASATKHPETGEVFIGKHHGESMEKAGIPFDDPLLRSPTGAADKVNGFITSTGRFVSRAEALTVAQKAKQIEGPAEAPGRKKLSQEDLDAFEQFGKKPVEKTVTKPVEPSKPKAPKKEIYTDIAVRDKTSGEIEIVDRAKGGHIVAEDKLMERIGPEIDPEDGMVTDRERFVPRKDIPKDKEGVEIDGTELIGKEVPVEKKAEKPLIEKPARTDVKVEVEKAEAATGPVQAPPTQAAIKRPLITESQKAEIEKKKATKKAQLDIESAEEAKAAVQEMIRTRRYNLNLAAYETNLLINSIEKVTTKVQREILPFVMEKTDVPEAFNRPDLVKAYEQYGVSLSPLGRQVAEHFSRGFQKAKESSSHLSAQEIEDYVTHIWDIPKGKKREVTNWFVTQNRFLKKRYIPTLKEGIEKFGLTPKALDITEIIRIHDSILNRVIENNKFVEGLKKLKKDGVPLVERSDLAPADWILFDHPALRKGMVIPGEIKRGEKVSQDLGNILTEMGVAIGRRISPTVFGKPSKVAGLYKSGDPPEVRFQRFMSNKTIAHEIGHHIDSALNLGQEFLNNYKTELYAISRERIEASKGEKGKYGEEYTASKEEQIAEFFATLFTDLPKANKLAPTATADVLVRMQEDGAISKLIDFDFEKNAKNLIEEQMSMMVRIPLKVHPDLEKPLKVIFEDRLHDPRIHAYEMINGVLKKTKLSISLFHHVALAETGMALVGPIKVGNILFNPVKIYRALVRGELDVYKKIPIARKAISRGLQLGATSDIPVSMIQDKLNDFARKTKDIIVLNRVTSFIESFNKTWDKALWDYLHDTLKLYAYESLALRVDPSNSSELIKKQEEEIAQFVNDTFGGQNWDILMVSPRNLQFMSWGLLSPDWTISTVRQALSIGGIGRIHKETRGLRKKLGRLFWLKAGLYFGVGVNVLNYTFREWDIRKNPKYYKGTDPSFLDKTMWGNTIGKKFNLFVGRYEDGTERYIRQSKQFKEVPELLFDETGFNPINSTLHRLGGKMAPAAQEVFKILSGGVTASGFRDDDLYGKKGWNYTLGIAKSLLKSPLPFSSRSLFREDKEFHISDIAFPSSKGMTRYNAISLFKEAIRTSDEELLQQVYIGALRNNLPAYLLFIAGLTSLKAESSREFGEGLKTIEDLKERAIAGITDTEAILLLKREKRINKENRDRKIGIKLLQTAIDEAKLFEAIKDAEKLLLKK